MKKLLIIGLVLLLVAGFAFARPRNGTFTGTGTSYNAATSTTDGTIEVRITVRGRRIAQIDVVNATDSPAFLTMVTNQVVPAIIQGQDTNVSIVSGATYTSRGLIEAVDAALIAAR